MKYSVSIEELIDNKVLYKLKKIKNRLETLYISCIVSIVIGMLSLFLNTIFKFKGINDYNILNYSIALCLGFGICSAYIYLKKIDLFKDKYKEDIVPIFLNKISKNIKYFPKSYISEEVVRNSNMYLPFDNITGEDYLKVTKENKKEKYEIEISEIHTSFKDEKLSKVEQIIKGSFKGIFLHANIAYSYPGIIKILHTQGMLDKVNSKIKEQNFKIYFESNTFEEKFDVYASDQINVRRIVTPKLMEKLENICAKFSDRPELVINGQDIYIKLHYGSFLDFYSRGKIVDKNKLEKDYNVLIELLDLINIMALNIEKLEVE